MEKVNIEYVPLGSLIEADRNPKEHDIGALITSLRRFGFVAPAIMNETTGKIVVGHGRREALLQMRDGGEAPPAKIPVDKKSGEWMVPVLKGIAFATDADAEAYLIADNRMTELGGWNHAALYEVLRDLATVEGLGGTGYDGDDVDAMAYLFDTDASPFSPVGSPPEGVEGADTRSPRLIVVFDDGEQIREFFRALPCGERAYRETVVTYHWDTLNGKADG